MKEYVKIKSDKAIQEMPDLYKASWDIRNDETTRDFCAEHDNWLIKRNTEQPEYDPKTQYLTSYYEEENGFAVQKWEIHELPTNETEE